jgi:phage gp36-like protein
MAYSTPAMVRQALVPTSDGSPPDPLTHTAADLSDAQLLDAISEADATIDGYIGGHYAVPVAPVSGVIPSPLAYWSRTVAAYLATCTYRQSLDFADTDPVARRYNAVMSALNAVSTAKMVLQLPSNESGNASSGAGAPVNPYVGDLWTPDDFSVNAYPATQRWNW